MEGGDRSQREIRGVGLSSRSDVLAAQRSRRNMRPVVWGSLLRTQSDARLVALSRDGNPAAFEASVLRYRDSLWRYCHRLSLPATPLVVDGLSTNWAASGNAGRRPRLRFARVHAHDREWVAARRRAP